MQPVTRPLPQTGGGDRLIVSASCCRQKKKVHWSTELITIGCYFKTSITFFIKTFNLFKHLCSSSVNLFLSLLMSSINWRHILRCSRRVLCFPTVFTFSYQWESLKPSSHFTIIQFCILSITKTGKDHCLMWKTPGMVQMTHPFYLVKKYNRMSWQ